MTNTEYIFLSLVRSGLWEESCSLLPYGTIDFNEVYKLAEEQSVVGLVAAGLEHVSDMKVPRGNVLPFLTQVIALEQRNTAMNAYLCELFSDLYKNDIFAVLIKGQGIAQCYERPLWRASGDIDLFLDKDNYLKTKKLLTPRASCLEEENYSNLHYGMNVDGWVVELHGTLNTTITKSIDNAKKEIQDLTLRLGDIKLWCDINGESQVVIPVPTQDNNIIIIFTHILQHFYREGIGLRQICDWCRLLWTYRNQINKDLLSSRLKQMDVLDEWRAFATFAVKYLGMPVNAMPFYEDSIRWSRKAKRVLSIVLKKGNLGHNEDKSYYDKHSFIVVKAISLKRWLKDYTSLITIFPKNAFRSLGHIITNGFAVAARKIF